MASLVDIQIPNIEKELNRMGEQSGDKKQQKACLFTLIIYAHDPRRASYLQELVETILDKFPCRLIYIQSDNKTEKPYFHVDVSNVISGQVQSGLTITCDQISIKVSENQLSRVPFVIMPHIIPDLPVYLLWGQNPFEESAIFPYLQPYASRVIFDSECSDSLKSFCKEMQKNLDILKIDVMDINWAFISNWRDMLVQLIDTREKGSELDLCHSITITYNNYKSETFQHPEIRSIYLQGWLASRLKWRYLGMQKQEQNLIINYETPKKPIAVILSPDALLDLPPGGIASIDISNPTGTSYYIARKPNLSQVVIHISTLDKCELPFTLPLPNVHRGLTFLKEIFYSSLGDHYREMLKMVSQIESCTSNK